MQVHLSLVAPNVVALAALGANYGVTWPQRVVVDIGAKKSGDTWVPSVRTITGEYSRQARVLGHQTDIREDNFQGVANAGNYQTIITGLNNLGEPGNTVNFYSLAAVVAHESQHAVRCRQALDDQRLRIQLAIQAVTIPLASAATETAAVLAIQALPAYYAAVQNAFNWWEARFDALIDGDHHGNGPCETAERRVITPLIQQIQAHAVTSGWVASPAPQALPAGSLSLAQRLASGGWH